MSGEIVSLVLREMYIAAETHKFDVALVTNDRAMYPFTSFVHLLFSFAHFASFISFSYFVSFISFWFSPFIFFLLLFFYKCFPIFHSLLC